MYEIDLSTLIIIGIDEENSKVITTESTEIVHESAKKIIDNSCRYFGSTLQDKIKSTNILVKMASKTPIIIEETRNIIFFPLKSTREKNNIWVSFNNLEKYEKVDNQTILYFKNNIQVIVDFSYYIVDNQVTRSLILDYEVKKRKESL